jgi:hypothetical protein
LIYAKVLGYGGNKIKFPRKIKEKRKIHIRASSSIFRCFGSQTLPLLSLVRGATSGTSISGCAEEQGNTDLILRAQIWFYEFGFRLEFKRVLNAGGS